MTLVSPQQLADLLDVSVETVYRRARRGDWPHYRVGPRLRFDVDRVLAALEVSPSEPVGSTLAP